MADIHDSYTLETGGTQKNLELVDSIISKLNKTIGQLNTLTKNVTTITGGLVVAQNKLITATTSYDKVASQTVSTVAESIRQSTVDSTTKKEQTIIYNGLNRAVAIVTTSLQDQIRTNQQSISSDRDKAATVNALAQAEKEAAKATRDRAVAAQVQTRFEYKFGDPLSADTRAASLKLQELSGQIYKIAEASQLTAKVLKQMIDDTATGKVVKYTGRLRETAVAIEKVALEFRKLYQEQGRIFTSAQSTIQKLTISWTSFAKFFATHVVYQMVWGVINAFQTGVKEAAKFQKQLTEIRTISFSNQQTVEEWADSVRMLADTYGKSLGEVAEGVYQTLSNQIAFGADTAYFMNTALKLAAVTVSDVSTAVSALSSVIKGYGLSVGESEKASALLFKTVELGRVRLDEMGDSLGNIIPFAAQLNVSYEELMSLISGLTRTGVSFEKVQTLIRATLQKLAQPTEEMIKLLNKYGYETGEAMIAAEGVEGAFKIINEEAKGSATELGQLFSRLRAIVGAAAITNALKDIGSDLEKLTNVSLADFRKAFALTFETPGVRLQKEFQKLQNYFLRDVGFPILKTLDNIVAKFGGLTNIVKLVTSATANFFTVLLTFKTVAFIIQLNIDKIKILGIALNELTAKNFLAELSRIATSAAFLKTVTAGFITAAIVGFYKLQAAAADSHKQMLAFRDLIKSIDNETLNEVNTVDQLTAVREKYTKALITGTQEVLKALAAKNALQLRWAKQVAVVEEQASKNLTAAMDKASQTIEANIQKIDTAIEKLKSDLEASQNYFDSLTERISNLKFEESLELKTPEEQIEAYKDKIQELSDTADTLYGQGKYEEARKYYDKVLDLIGTVKDKMKEVSTDPETGTVNVKDNTRVNELLALRDSIVAKILSKEREIQRVLQDRITEQEKQKQQDETRLENYKKYRDEIVAFKLPEDPFEGQTIQEISAFDVNKELANFDTATTGLLKYTTSAEESIALLNRLDDRRASLVQSYAQKQQQALIKADNEAVSAIQEGAQLIQTTYSDALYKVDSDISTTTANMYAQMSKASSYFSEDILSTMSQIVDGNTQLIDNLIAKIEDLRGKIPLIAGTNIPTDPLSMGRYNDYGSIIKQLKDIQQLDNSRININQNIINKLREIGGLYTAIKNQVGGTSFLTAEQLKTLEDVSKVFLRSDTSTYNLSQNLNNSGIALNGITAAMPAVISAVDALDKQIANVQTAATTSFYALNNLAAEAAAADATQNLDYLTRRLDEVGQELVINQAWYEAISASLNEDQKKQTEELAADFASQLATVEQIRQSLGLQKLDKSAILQNAQAEKEATEATANSTGEIAENVGETVKPAEEIGNSSEKTKDKYETIAEIFKDLPSQFDTVKEKQDIMSQKFTEALTPVQDTKTTLTEIPAICVSIGDSFQQSYTERVKDAKTLTSDLVGLVKDLNTSFETAIANAVKLNTETAKTQAPTTTDTPEETTQTIFFTPIRDLSPVITTNQTASDIIGGRGQGGNSTAITDRSLSKLQEDNLVDIVSGIVSGMTRGIGKSNDAGDGVELSQDSDDRLAELILGSLSKLETIMSFNLSTLTSRIIDSLAQSSPTVRGLSNFLAQMSDFGSPTKIQPYSSLTSPARQQNINVGDINITVHNTSGNQIDVQELGRQLQLEVRRGVIALS